MIDINSLGLAFDMQVLARNQQSLGGLTAAVGSATTAVNAMAKAASSAEQSIQRIVAAAGKADTTQKKADTTAGQQGGGGKSGSDASGSKAATGKSSSDASGSKAATEESPADASDPKVAADKAGTVAKSEVNAQTKAWNDLFNTVETGLSDSLYNAISSGKDVFDSLGADIEKWFKTTVLKMAIQGVVQLGLGGLANALDIGSGEAAGAAGGGSGLLGLLSAASGAKSLVSSAASASAFFGGVGTGASAVFGEAGAVGGVNTAIAAFQAGNTAAGIGTLLGVATPALAVAAVVGALSHSTKLTDTGLNLGFQGTGLGAVAFDTSQTSSFFGLSKSSHQQYNALPTDQLNNLNQWAATYTNQLQGLFTGVGLDFKKGVQGFVEPAKDYSLNGLTDAQKTDFLTKYFSDVQERMAQFALGDQNGVYAKSGETAVQTLTRLGTALQGVNPILKALSETALQATLSGGNAASKLVDLFGSVDNFSSAAQTYYANFYTDAERTAKTTADVTAALGTVGLKMPATRDGFRALVDAQDLTTDSGRKAYATLLTVAGVFADLVPAADAAANASAAAAATLKKNASDASDAYDTLDRAVTAQKKSIDQAYQDNVEATQKTIDGLTTSVQKLQALADRLKSVLSGFATNSVTGMSQQEASAQIAAAIAIARSSGSLPDVASLDDALTVISQPVSLGARNAVQYLQQVDQQVALVSQLNGLTNDQLDAQQTELEVQRKMLDTLSKNHDADIAQLDDMLSAAKLQIDAINGVNTSVLSVAAALGNFNGAVQAAGGTGKVTSTGTTVPNGSDLANFISAAYENSLGRAPEADGLAYYTQLVNSGAATRDQVAGYIAASQEAQNHAASVPPVPMQAAVSQGYDLPQYAYGGVGAAGWAMVGEQGPELAHFGAPAQVFPSTQVKPLLAGSSDGVEQLLGQILARLTDDRSERNLQGKAAGQWRFEMLKRTKRIENNTGAVVPADEEETA